MFYTSGCVSPALGGIMAGAVISRLDGARGIPGWRCWLIIESVITIVCGFGRKYSLRAQRVDAADCLLMSVYFVLPNWPIDSKMLSPEQRLLAHVRILRDGNQSWDTEETALTPLQAFLAVIRDGRTYFFLIIYTANCLALTVSYFIPTMLRGMGYTSISAQWMTVPIWSCGAVFQLFW
jgi:hypothetical protein